MPVTAKVQKWGNTRALRIPKAIAQQIGFETGTEVTLTPTKECLMVSPVRRKKYRLRELLAQCRGPNPHREAIRGRTGKEIF